MQIPLRRAIYILVAALVVPAAMAPAAVKTAKFNVTATVQSDCTVKATDLTFGTVGILQANVDVTSTISVTCTPNTNYQIRLNAGTVASSTVDNRLMSNGAQTMQFQMYRDASHTQVWGQTDGTDTVGGSGSGNELVHTVYGRIPPQSTPGVGTYTTEIQATISY